MDISYLNTDPWAGIAKSCDEVHVYREEYKKYIIIIIERVYCVGLVSVACKYELAQVYNVLVFH